MQLEKSSYIVGEAVRDSDGRFLGHFVNELSDDFPDMGEEYKNKLLELNQFHGYFYFPNQTGYKIFDRRKVFSLRFGTVNQILTPNGVDGKDLVWINIDRRWV